VPVKGLVKFCSDSILPTVLFPEAIPPVRPITLAGQLEDLLQKLPFLDNMFVYNGIEAMSQAHYRRNG
jgi:hypothetical protein